MSCLYTLKYIIQEMMKQKNKLNQENIEMGGIYFDEVCCTLHEKKVVIDSLIKNLAFEIAIRDDRFTNKFPMSEIGIGSNVEKTSKNLISIESAMKTLNEVSDSGVELSEKVLEDILLLFLQKAESYLNHPFIKQYIVHDGKFKLFMGRTINTIKNVFLRKLLLL